MAMLLTSSWSPSGRCKGIDGERLFRRYKSTGHRSADASRRKRSSAGGRSRCCRVPPSDLRRLRPLAGARRLWCVTSVGLRPPASRTSELSILTLLVLIVGLSRLRTDITLQGARLPGYRRARPGLSEGRTQLKPAFEPICRNLPQGADHTGGRHISWRTLDRKTPTAMWTTWKNHSTFRTSAESGDWAGAADLNRFAAMRSRKLADIKHRLILLSCRSVRRPPA